MSPQNLPMIQILYEYRNQLNKYRNLGAALAVLYCFRSGKWFTLEKRHIKIYHCNEDPRYHRFWLRHEPNHSIKKYHVYKQCKKSTGNAFFCNHCTEKQRQRNLVFEDSLVYIASSRTTMTVRLCLKNKFGLLISNS